MTNSFRIMLRLDNLPKYVILVKCMSENEILILHSCCAYEESYGDICSNLVMSNSGIIFVGFPLSKFVDWFPL